MLPGANDPKAVAMDPAPNMKPVADKGGGLAGGAAGACVNSDGAQVLNVNTALLMMWSGWLTIQTQMVQRKSSHHHC